MIFVIDNYDSFTYNIVQYLGELGADLLVCRNDEVTVEQIRNDLKPERILISPGPGTPDDAGVSLEVLKKFGGQVTDFRGLFRTSGNRADFRRQSRSCADPRSRQIRRNLSRRERRF